MKRIVSLIVTVALLAACFSAFSVNAASNSITFAVGSDEEEAYVYGWGAPITTEGGDVFRKIVADDYLVYRFEIPANTTKASISMPVEGPYVIYAAGAVDEEDVGASIDSWKKIDEAGDLDVADDPYMTSRYIPHFEDKDLTPVLKDCKNGEIFVIVGLQPGSDWCGLWTLPFAVDYLHKYVNRDWNVKNGFDKNGDGTANSRSEIFNDYGDERYAGYDGKVNFMYTTEGKVPEETKAPETAAPETKAPETAAPETKAPETAAPETKAPETAVPDETAASTETTGETKGETTAETKAPETAASETKTETKGSEETKKADNKKSGCKSVVAAAAIVPMLLAAAYVCGKKH